MDFEENQTPESTEPAKPQDAGAREEVKREIVEFVKMVVWFLILFFSLRHFVVESFEVEGPSMEPTLVQKERILVLKIGQFPPFSWFMDVEAGDIIVFESPDDEKKRYVKRVIAAGPESSGNTVQAEDGSPATEVVHVRMEEKNIYVNNQRIEEDYIEPEALTTEHRRDFDLPPGKLFVLGDNRKVSKDSRAFGAVDENRIVGRALIRFWPLSRFRFLR